MLHQLYGVVEYHVDRETGGPYQRHYQKRNERPDDHEIDVFAAVLVLEFRSLGGQKRTQFVVYRLLLQHCRYFIVNTKVPSDKYAVGVQIVSDLRFYHSLLESFYRFPNNN